MKRFGRLLLMEMENVWRFPMLELVVVVAILSTLRISTPVLTVLEPERAFTFGLQSGLDTSILFLSFIIPVLAARGLAKALSGNEMRVLLSYPVKRWEVLLSKIVIVFVPIFAVFSGLLLFNAFYVYHLPFLSPFPYSLLATALLLPTVFATALSFNISLFTKDELKTVLLSIFVLLGLGLTLNEAGSPYKYMSPDVGSSLISQYLVAHFYRGLGGFFQNHTTTDVQVAFAFPILTSILLLVAAFAYFRFKLDVD